MASGCHDIDAQLSSPGIPQPRSSVPVPTPLRPDSASGTLRQPRASTRVIPQPQDAPPLTRVSAPPDPDAPLLSIPAVQAVLTAFSPAARRYVRSLDASGRHAAATQRELQQVGRFAVRCEQARQATEADRARLYRLAQQQQHALVTSAARLASMQAHCDEQRTMLREERARSRTLERGLRSMARDSTPCRDTAVSPPVAAAWDALGIEELPAD